MKFHGQTFLGQTVVDVPMTRDPRGWPVLWTSPLSLSPERAVDRARAECGLAESFVDATCVSTGTLNGWLIETDGPRLFWSGKRREGFALRQEPSTED